MTADTQAPRLEPCPFCGSTETSHGYESPPERGVVQCHSCGAFLVVDAMEASDAEEAAITAWNTRRTDPVREAMATQLQVAADQFRFYEREHRAKADRLHDNWDGRSTEQENDHNAALKKAETNRHHAEACEAVLHLHKGEG